MLDFTSVLYLGFRHAHPTLRPWAQLTTGRPAALEAAPEAERVAQDLAQLLRCERAVLAPSTLHLYWDLFDVLARDHIAIYADAGRSLAGASSGRLRKGSRRRLSRCTIRPHSKTSCVGTGGQGCVRWS